MDAHEVLKPTGRGNPPYRHAYNEGACKVGSGRGWKRKREGKDKVSVRNDTHFMVNIQLYLKDIEHSRNTITTASCIQL